MANKTICGMDEAGRGPLAGPIVAAAVIAPNDFDFNVFGTVPVSDSKRMTERRRELWAEDFKIRAEGLGLGWQIYQIEVPQINASGIGWANREVFRQLVLMTEADQYIIDGNHKITALGDKQARAASVVRADQQFAIVMAASILAKTHRDNIMRELHEQFPHYQWHQNKGYGTKYHIAAIRRYGVTPHHRRGKFTDTVEKKKYGKWMQQVMFTDGVIYNEPDAEEDDLLGS